MTESPLRILHVYKDYYPILGGMENHIRTLAEAQAARGHDVTVLVTSRTPHTTIEALNHVRLVRTARWATVASTPISPATFWWITRINADIAHLHLPYPPGDVANVLLGRASRTVMTYHSDIVRQKNLLRFYAPFLRYSLKRADRIIATSPRYVETSAILKHYANKCAIVPYGIELARFQTADATLVSQIREQHGQPLALFVGQLRYYKGVEYLVRAMARVPGKALVIGSESTTHKTELERIAREAGVAERIVFLGEKDAELPAFYHACDVFVLPSVERSEAFGIVQIEAMAAGKPVISTELGTGTSWINQHNVTGLVVPPRDPEALARAINSILADPARRAEMGRAARQRAQAEFSQETMVARVEQVYRSVLNA